MPSTPRTSFVFAARSLLLLAMASWAQAQAASSVGCYSSIQPLKNQGSYAYQSVGHCTTLCQGLNMPVFGLSDAQYCWCGSELPAANTKASNSSCDTPCQGYPQNICGGGTEYYSVWLSGLDSSVPSLGGSGGSSPSSSSSATSTHTPTKSSPKVVTSVIPGQTTVVVTQPAEATASSEPTKNSSSGGSNVGGIAAGVVIGVLAVTAIVAGLFFYLRHRRRKAAEEEYARSNQVGDFMRGGKPPTTSYSTTSDSRLDPEAGKRNSSGSIADDQDYSRRILRVANPDRS